jgi:hypothetical protein
VAQRYARALGINARDLSDALQAAREAVRQGTPMPAPKRGDTLTDGAAGLSSAAAIGDPPAPQSSGAAQ